MIREGIEAKYNNWFVLDLYYSDADNCVHIVLEQL